MKFTAEMQPTNESIHQLSKVQHHAFRPGVRLLWSGCGVASIWGAVNAGDQFLFYLLMFAGIWLLPNLELPAKHQADKIIKAATDLFPIRVTALRMRRYKYSAGITRSTLRTISCMPCWRINPIIICLSIGMRGLLWIENGFPLMPRRNGKRFFRRKAVCVSAGLLLCGRVRRCFPERAERIRTGCKI